MKEHPILFSSGMVQAILKGTKTQTRRLVKGNTPEAKYPWKLGDRLWVRETWKEVINLSGEKQYRYKAGVKYISTAGNWRPSIHMPREACRILLEIDGLRLEQLQEIAEEDAKAEGVKPVYVAWETPYRAAFHALWIDMYRSKEVCWEANPWVWAIKFRVLEDKNTIRDQAI